MDHSEFEAPVAGGEMDIHAQGSRGEVDDVRSALKDAYERRDLHAMLEIGKDLDRLMVTDAKAAYQRGVLPMFCNKDHSLYQVVHPSTRTPGSIQITTYMAGSGALSDTTVRTIDDIAREINYASWTLVPDSDVARILGELGAAEAAYQERVSRRRQSSSELSVAPT